jgi:hypothetical protein
MPDNFYFSIYILEMRHNCNMTMSFNPSYMLSVPLAVINIMLFIIKCNWRLIEHINSLKLGLGHRCHTIALLRMT